MPGLTAKFILFKSVFFLPASEGLCFLGEDLSKHAFWSRVGGLIKEAGDGVGWVLTVEHYFMYR